MTTPTTPRARRTAASLGAFALAVLALSGCGGEPPAGNTTGAPTPTATNTPKPDAVPAAPAAPVKPLAVKPTIWPGIEARLTRAQPRAGLLVVEVQLANTGGAPVTIDNYTAADATVITDVSKEIFGVFSPPGGQPSATANLTQTLAPGETTTVNAAFPIPATSALATLTFPNLGIFEAVPLHPQRQAGGESPADASARAKAKADNRARAMSGGRDNTKAQ